MASQCIYIKPESLQNHSFHLGSRSSRTPPRSQRRDQNCISYQHLCRSLLILCSSQCHTRRPKLPTVHIDIAIYTKELWHSYTDLQPLSQGTLPSYSYNQLQCIKQSNCTPAVEPQNDVDALSRSRRSICYAHVMIAVAARFDSE